MRKKTKISLRGNSQKKVNPLRVNMARIFLCLSAVLWLAYGVYIYFDMAVVNKNTGSADILTLFAFINAGLLLFSGIKFGNSKKWVYVFALVVTVYNTLLTLMNITDLYFLVFFCLNLFILWAILPLRRNYFPKP
jgi:hypothetical protein